MERATGFEPATFSLGNDRDRAVKQLVSASSRHDVIRDLSEVQPDALKSTQERPEAVLRRVVHMPPRNTLPPRPDVPAERVESALARPCDVSLDRDVA